MHSNPTTKMIDKAKPWYDQIVIHRKLLKKCSFGAKLIKPSTKQERKICIHVDEEDAIYVNFTDGIEIQRFDFIPKKGSFLMLYSHIIKISQELKKREGFFVGYDSKKLIKEIENTNGDKSISEWPAEKNEIEKETLLGLLSWLGEGKVECQETNLFKELFRQIIAGQLNESKCVLNKLIQNILKKKNSLAKANETISTHKDNSVQLKEAEKVASGFRQETEGQKSEIESLRKRILELQSQTIWQHFINVIKRIFKRP